MFFGKLRLSTTWLIMLWLEEIWDIIKDIMIKLRAIETVWYKLENTMICYLEIIQEYLNTFKVLQKQYLKKQIKKRFYYKNHFFRYKRWKIFVLEKLYQKSRIYLDLFFYVKNG